jgi:branched chain amino acid efflux pump
MDAAPPDRRASWRAGIRAGVPYAAAGLLLSASFGVLAREAGFSAPAAIVMSVVVFAGSAQFASVSIVAAGGGLGPAVLAAGLMNSRFLAMGIAFAPSLPGGPLKRAAQGQPVVDASWAMAMDDDGAFDRWFLFGASAIQYVAWQLGTTAGALGGGSLDAEKFGLDAIYPTFFLGLLITELKTPRARAAAAIGAVLALALTPVLPPGLPVLAASAGAAIGLRPTPPARTELAA